MAHQRISCGAAASPRRGRAGVSTPSPHDPSTPYLGHRTTRVITLQTQPGHTGGGGGLDPVPLPTPPPPQLFVKNSGGGVVGGRGGGGVTGGRVSWLEMLMALC